MWMTTMMMMKYLVVAKKTRAHSALVFPAKRHRIICLVTEARVRYVAPSCSVVTLLFLVVCVDTF